ncbi:DUF116 domain-containing protein [bacterium]|nr:DUF116 domain-containing protein [bacterium]
MSGSSFRSPWQGPWRRIWVAAVRRLLRPAPRFETRFIAWLVERQNRRVRRHLRRQPPRSALLILPRCVKQTGCRVDVQTSVEPCLSCRACPVGDAAAACADRGLTALVAFRSHIAFALAREHRPDVIVATACHDRLIKALVHVPEFPALLAPLTGMAAPCRDATFDTSWLVAELDRVAPPAPAVAVR